MNLPSTEQQFQTDIDWEITQWTAPGYFKSQTTEAERWQILFQTAQRMVREYGERRRQALNEGMTPEHPMTKHMLDEQNRWRALSRGLHRQSLQALREVAERFTAPPSTPAVEMTAPTLNPAVHIDGYNDPDIQAT